tara:strand:- start:1246 stop:1581 length:336 start_codon:yes stop_codon:yes gene_type:complete
MKIRAKRNILVNGFHLPAGDVVEVSDRDGNYLIQIGRAELAMKRGLIDISGIGVVELDVLAGLGIRDFAALAGADPKALGTALGMSQKVARAMIGDAAGFLGQFFATDERG